MQLEGELKRGDGPDHHVAEVGHLVLGHCVSHVDRGLSSSDGKVLWVDEEPEAWAGPVDGNSGFAPGECRVPYETVQVRLWHLEWALHTRDRMVLDLNRQVSSIRKDGTIVAGLDLIGRSGPCRALVLFRQQDGCAEAADDLTEHHL